MRDTFNNKKSKLSTAEKHLEARNDIQYDTSQSNI